jgi:hypothetical protein
LDQHWLPRKLRTKHGIDLAKETVRRLQISVGLWIPRKLRPPKIHQPRVRRACIGELVQIDGCEHHWFEDRARKLTSNLTLHYESKLYLLPDTAENRRYAGKYLEIYQFPDGRIQIRAAGVPLPYSTYDKLGAIDQGAIVENKRLGHALRISNLVQAERDNRSEKAFDCPQDRWYKGASQETSRHQNATRVESERRSTSIRLRVEENSEADFSA